MFKDFTKDILKAQNGDKEILQNIVQENQGLIWGIVKRFSGRGYEVEDLYQIGAIGFIKAIKRYHWYLGCKTKNNRRQRRLYN